MKISRNVAIVVAGGSGARFGGETPKQYLELDGKPIINYSLDFFERSRLADEVILVVSKDYLVHASREIVDKFGFKKVKKITAGGEYRQESVLAGLSSCAKGIDLAIIHDAVRPFLANDLLLKLVNEADQTGAAILAVPAKESIKLVTGGKITKTLQRDSVWIAQTPQVFQFDKILDAHRKAEDSENEATDDSQLFEQYYGDVSVVRGSYNNIKITTKGDFAMAQAILRGL